ncbi:alpha/beta hydrolase [Acetobacter sp.]|uniref:alpha/beta hydrolase n=1 Tax=Acetobacter sp. TaxID=440 RepID=UPI0039E83549
MIRRNAVSSNHPHTLLSISERLKRRSLKVAACLTACLALAGCANEPIIHVPSRYAGDARLVPPDRILTLSDGARIPIRVWPARGRERGRILALHGFNDSRDAWEASAPRFAEAGFTVWAPDIRGFGAAPRRGGWVGTDRLVRDAQEELADLHGEAPAQPIWLMGESMGGAVALLAAERPDTPALSGLVLLAPALWDLQTGKIPVHLLAAIVPDGKVSGRELPVHVVATDNIAALRRLYFDPLTLHVTKIRALNGLVDLMDAGAHAVRRVHCPTLIIYGDRDQIVPSDAMARAWRRFPAFVRRDLIPGGHHLLLRDRSGGRVEADILSWLTDPNSFLPSGGDVSAAVWASQNGGMPRGVPQKVNEPFPLLPAKMDTLLSP